MYTASLCCLQHRIFEALLRSSDSNPLYVCLENLLLHGNLVFLFNLSNSLFSEFLKHSHTAAATIEMTQERGPKGVALMQLPINPLFSAGQPLFADMPVV